MISVYMISNQMQVGSGRVDKIQVQIVIFITSKGFYVFTLLKELSLKNN